MAAPFEESIEDLLATPLFAGADNDVVSALRNEATMAAGAPAPPAVEDDRRLSRRYSFLEFHDFAQGEVLMPQGLMATDLFVILSGRVEAIQTRPGSADYYHREYRRGEWFGDDSLHWHHPALASYVASEPTRAAVIESRLFYLLWANATFQSRMLQNYRGLNGKRNNTALHLRLSPLYRELDDRDFEMLEANATLLTHESGDVVAKSGDRADCVYLVRSGAITCCVQVNGGERVLAYYKGNATFGEHTLLSEDAKWHADYRAFTTAAVLQIRRSAFDRFSEPSRRRLLRAANRLIGRDDALVGTRDPIYSTLPRTTLDELFVMVERESAKGGRALAIDRHKCIRCNLCVESCVAVHDDGQPRLSKIGNTVGIDQVLVTACYHCETPECMLSCEYAAIQRDQQGRVRFDYTNCVGCASCIERCPYGVIRLVGELAPKRPPSFLQSLPLVGRWFEPVQADVRQSDFAPTHAVGAGGTQKKIEGKTVKCDSCEGLPFEACVYNCPTTAIQRRQPQELFDRDGGA